MAKPRELEVATLPARRRRRALATPDIVVDTLAVWSTHSASRVFEITFWALAVMALVQNDFGFVALMEYFTTEVRVAAAWERGPGRV